MDRLTHRVLARVLRSDLSPPLGDPGGPCQVIQRIEDHVRNPRLKEDLIQDISQGQSLSNPDASKVYDLDQETGAGLARSLVITPHAQYRMDLRGVTVDDVTATLRGLAKQLNDWKSQRNPAYQRFAGPKVEWLDPKTGLFVAVDVFGRDRVVLITTYWKGKSDPRPVPPEFCNI